MERIDLTSAQVIGCAELLALSSPSNTLNKPRWRSPSLFAPEQQAALSLELDALIALERWLTAQPPKLQQELQQALSQLPDLEPLLRRLAIDEPIKDEDLFVLKRALYYGHAALTLAPQPLAARLGDEPAQQWIERCAALCQAIHPEATTLSPRFMLLDTLNAELGAARQAYKQAKRAYQARARELEREVLTRYPGARFSIDGALQLPQAADAATLSQARQDQALCHSAQGWRLADEPLRELELAQERASQALLSCEAQTREALKRAHIKPAQPWIEALQEALLDLDLRLAKLELKRKLDGCWPTVAPPLAPHQLQAGRSPFITQAQPIDATLNPRQGVIITGPNMGGKSEAMKLVGLCQWCLQSALPCPATRFEAPLYEAIVYVGADETREQAQLHQGLSAFGREVRRIVEWSQPQIKPTLWLLDEPCRGTHPEEGQALALQIIAQRLDAGDAVLATTHFPALAASPTAQHFRIAGLRDDQRLELALSQLEQHDLEALTSALKAAMDYRLIPTPHDAQAVPRDAARIAAALGLRLP